ncbi:MAG: hypothetical protein JJU20_04375 [Opitutales bacterium]|nr:hypothetical protein [Opitutales bacterium]
MNTSPLKFLLLGCLAPVSLLAIQTHVMTESGLSDFSEGQLENLSLNQDGRLEPAPALKPIAQLSDPVVWAAVADSENNVYIGTGNRGRVLRMDPEGELTTVFEPDGIIVRALAVDEDGFVYVGTSPQGAIYRLHPDQDYPEVFYDPDAAYIWDFVIHDGALWVITGYNAELWRVPLERSNEDQPERWFTTPENHFTALHISEEKGILIGSAPNGTVYQVKGKDDAYALSRGEEEEVSTIWVDGDRIWFSTISAREERSSRGGNRQGGSGSDVSGSSGSGGNSTPRGVRPQRARSGLYMRGSNGFVEPVWQSGQESISSLLRSERGFWLLGLDTDGKIIALQSRDEWSWIQRVPNGGEVTFLMPAPDSRRDVLVFTSNPAAVYRLGGRGQEAASYTSPVRDATQTVRWGNLEIGHEGSLDLKVETRSGNTPEPDNVWSEWAGVESVSSQAGIWRGRVDSPASRYLQYRIRLGEEQLRGAIHQVRTFVQLANVAPFLLDLRVLPFGVDAVTGSTGARQFDLESMLQTDDPDRLGQASGPRTQFSRLPDLDLRTVAWRAFDPNNDRLRFDVYLQRVDSEDWVRIRSDLEESFTLLNLNGLEEGYYRVRVNARDDLDNPPEEAGSTQRISTPFLVDHQPPVIEVDEKSIDGNRLRLYFSVRDEWSVIRDVRVRIDGEEGISVRPVDGIFDSNAERFEWEKSLRSSDRGSVSVVIEAVDESGRRASHAFSLPRTRN